MSKNKLKQSRDLNKEKKQERDSTVSDGDSGRASSFPDMIKKHPAAMAFALVLVFLLLADVTIHKNEPVTVGNIPEFYALYGFFGAMVLVFSAKVLLVLFGQSENKK